MIIKQIFSLTAPVLSTNHFVHPPLPPLFSHQAANRAPLSKHCENWNIKIIFLKQIYLFNCFCVDYESFSTIYSTLPCPSSATKQPIEPHCPNIALATWSANSLVIVVLEIIA